MSTLESFIERRVAAKVRVLGVPSIRLCFMKGVEIGWPDRLFLLPQGRALWIEFKRKGEVPTPLQLHRHRLLKLLGHDVQVHDDV